MWGLDVYWKDNYSIAVYDIEKIRDDEVIYDKKFNSIYDFYMEVNNYAKVMEGKECVEVYICRYNEDNEFEKFEILLKRIERYLENYKEKYPEYFV